MPPSQTILIQNIQRSTNAIGRIHPDGLTGGLMGRDQAEALLLLCVVCLDDIASALKQDTDAGASIPICLHNGSEPQMWTLAQCRDWCSEVKSRVSEYVYRFRIQQALLQANVWISDLQEPGSLSEDQTIFAAETGSILLQVLQDALAAGVSETMTVELNEEPVPLAHVRKLGLYIAAAGKTRRAS